MHLDTSPNNMGPHFYFYKKGGSLQKEKYPLQAFLSYLNDPATTAQRLKIFLGLGLVPKKPKYCNIIKKNKTIFKRYFGNKYFTNETTNNNNGNSIGQPCEKYFDELNQKNLYSDGRFPT